MTVATQPRSIRDMELERLDPAVVARIRKMLAVAEVKAGEDVEAREGEIANALAMAQRMMTELNLSMEDVAGLTAEAKREEEEAKKPIYKTARRPESSVEFQWKHAMAVTIATANFCDLLTSRTHFFVVGRPHNVSMTQELMDSVFPQVTSLATYASGHRKRTGDRAKDWEIMHIPTPTYRLSYCLGVAAFLGQKLSAARDTDNVQLRGTTALVLDTKRANREFMEEMWPTAFGPKAKKNRNRGSRGNQTHTEAWGHGYSEGGRVDVSVDARRVVGKVTPALGNGRS